MDLESKVECFEKAGSLRFQSPAIKKSKKLRENYTTFYYYYYNLQISNYIFQPKDRGRQLN